jgi:hypothetical protein
MTQHYSNSNKLIHVHTRKPQERLRLNHDETEWSRRLMMPPSSTSPSRCSPTKFDNRRWLIVNSTTEYEHRNVIGHHTARNTQEEADLYELVFQGSKQGMTISRWRWENNSALVISQPSWIRTSSPMVCKNCCSLCMKVQLRLTNSHFVT